MVQKDLVPIIFANAEVVDKILNDPDESSTYYSMLNYGLASKRFLFLDYKGEEGNEIINYILDYEFAHNLELGTSDELELLGDFYVLFIASIGDKEGLTQVDLLKDEDIPKKERHIQLYI
ncbi:hypothetical protein [Paenibacillus sp. JJ-223]|uniref:hypothetical protein n=1 Tax=Paenibacillus sp. JJ-223 TaxID=2905647 RepID=UPI001F2FA435|nr:hypothetical protein [Paenibacillus sp. JJ-223]CAH1225049.1 hypothetical protein PAECIP111890_05733 [Paenibacillus sp. JJ-223]